MKKIRATATEIGEELAKRLRSPDVLDGDCRHIRVPKPSWADPAHYKSNWNIQAWPFNEPCLSAGIAIMLKMQDEYELIE